MNRKVQFPGELKYFIPANNSWAKRFYLVFGFIFLDCFVTWIFCRTPGQEANVYARGLMEVYGIPLGLTIFNLLMSVPLYLTLSLDSHFVRLPDPWLKTTEFFVDIVFACFIAAPHFNGAASWFWQAPEILRKTLGAILYIILIFALIKLPKSQ